MYKNFLCAGIFNHLSNVILGCRSNVIFNHLSNVIIGFIPRIHAKHYSLDTRDRLFVTPEYDGKGGSDISTPEDDRERSLVKGLDVVCQCAALWERRVQNSTRVRKAQAVTRQTNPIGRSMIEMLGVLAIIGVLSVGGIAGYSKAMEKFKINKTIRQISEIAANVRTLYAQQKDFNGLRYDTAIQMGVMPDDLEINASDYHNAFGGLIDIECNWQNSSYFQIIFSDMTKNACMALATADWGNISSTGVVGIGINNYTSVLYDVDPENCTTISERNGYFTCSEFLPISPAIAAQYCGKKDEPAEINAFAIIFKK